MDSKKFIESYDVDDYEVLTEDGWEDITHIHKTVPFQIWYIRTKDFELKCADEHIVIDENYNNVYVKDLKLGDNIRTIKGIQEINFISSTLESDNMYDLTVGSEKHTFYTNGILSHNSTISTIYILWYILFQQSKVVAMLANKEKIAIDILKRVKFAYQNLPLWLQQGICEWNKTEILLENGCRILAGSTSSDAARGYTISLLYLDEFAFVPNNIANDFMQSVYPTITSGNSSKIIIVSTPKGLNHYYDIWKKAINGDNGYMPIRVRWDEVPGRGEKFKEDTIADIGLVKWNQEFRTKFLGSSTTLIDPELLERIDTSDPIDIKMGQLLYIWEHPTPNSMYILGVDSAKGVGNDSSVIQVLKINNEHDIEQVAMYRYDMIDTYSFAQVCIEVSKYYNGAYMMVENNAEGGEVAQTIWYNFEYDLIINTDKKGIGTRSTKKSKLAANLLVKRYLEQGWLGLHDKLTLQELSRYEEVSPNIFKAAKWDHDDCVTSLIWGIYFLSTTFFDGKNMNVHKIDDQFKIGEDDDSAAGLCIFDDEPDNPDMF